MTIRYLTGITPSGIPHLGNYVGAIRPSVRSQDRADTESFYFLADLHSLIKSHSPLQTQRCTLEIASTWIACGLDPDKVTFYRQSDIPEILPLSWMLTCVTGKGLLNRAHAYKASVDKNIEAGVEPDTDVTAGLFMYPVLMAADIMMFKAHRVPVGRDQVQHLEMARDIAASFNHWYGNGQELLVLPQAEVDANVATLPGLDGRKMSKSYGNTIELFTPKEKLRKLIMGITTDSRAPGEPKDTENSAIFQIYQSFATDEQTEEMRQAFARGIAWGEAKELLFEYIDKELAPKRAYYDELIKNPSHIENILKKGAEKARAEAIPFLEKLRYAVGLRSLTDLPKQSEHEANPAPAVAPPQIKQYRENDGHFYFKLLHADGSVLLQSKAYEQPRDVGVTIENLRNLGSAALAKEQAKLQPFTDSPKLQEALALLVQQTKEKLAKK